jgi:hypothetical protein
MSDPDPDPQPNVGNDTEGKSSLSSSVEFLKLALAEWTPSLFDQPTQPPFGYNAKFVNEEGRIARLTVMVVAISLLLLGAISVFDNTNLRDIPGRALVLLVGCILVAITYKPFSYLCLVRIQPTQSDSPEPKPPLTLRQSAFAVILIFIPWVPILAFIRSRIPTATDPYQDLLFVAQFICFGYILVNFAKGIRVITKCPWYLIWPSISLPLVLLGIILTKVI